MISTKGRYALRFLIDLAERGEGARVPLKDVAARQGISEKYLQQIARTLVEGGMLSGASGRSGGYALTRPAEGYVVFDVLELVEGALAPVACLAPGAEPCERATTCKTLPLWQGLYEAERAYFSSVTLADLVAGLEPCADALQA
ncbi:MAG: Rrf2 family transcriptional regulator [Coriobacteriales bacterium]|nr:Rrf2 family transcriptional regulator [Atopobiaceae bacterium]MDO4539268.1 Rrf2 family transcriptional regulator [Coriobacteriales bacterium]